MASGVEELLDILYEMIDEAKSVPLSSEKCMIERDRALDLLDDIRAQFPMELKEAKKLLENRAEYINAAKREADAMKKQAAEEARKMVEEDQLLNQARQKSAEMIRVAEERGRELRRAANEYCEDALRRTEEAVAEAFEEIKQSRIRFRAAAGTASSQSNQNKVYDAAADED